MENKVIVRYEDGLAKAAIGADELPISACSSSDKGSYCPMDLISASLGTCITLTIAAVAENKKIKLERLEVQITRNQMVRSDNELFSILIDLGDKLSQREKVLLFNAARTCEVHKLLAGKNEFSFLLHNPEKE
jgi:uncharacterized OsmC-like protein